MTQIFSNQHRGDSSSSSSCDGYSGASGMSARRLSEGSDYCTERSFVGCDRREDGGTTTPRAERRCGGDNSDVAETRDEILPGLVRGKPRRRQRDRRLYLGPEGEWAGDRDRRKRHGETTPSDDDFDLPQAYPGVRRIAGSGEDELISRTGRSNARADRGNHGNGKERIKRRRRDSTEEADDERCYGRGSKSYSGDSAVNICASGGSTSGGLPWEPGSMAAEDALEAIERGHAGEGEGESP